MAVAETDEWPASAASCLQSPYFSVRPVNFSAAWNTVCVRCCVRMGGREVQPEKRLTPCPLWASAGGQAVVCLRTLPPLEWQHPSCCGHHGNRRVFSQVNSVEFCATSNTRCHESASRSTGSLTIAELTAYKAVCRSFNGLWFPTWPSWPRYLKSVKWPVFVFCLNS